MQAAARPESGITADEELYWLALCLMPGLGSRKAGQLLERFRTPQAIFHSSRSEIEAAGIAPSVASSIASGCSFDEAVDQQQKLAGFGASLISINDPRYPPALRNIFDPPPMLFARGRLELFANLMVGVVGTRRPTSYGSTVAARMAADLAAAGLTIASGMARGIDTAGHRAVLEMGGDTVAVFGCGVDQVYPAENRKLAVEIAEKGLLVSEFPMGAPPLPQNFPVRNRIISGMSAGILVVEGGEYSGSSITAKLAAEQGREIFAVPGNVTSKMSWGPNLLIKQGAKLVQTWTDVTVELKPEDRRRLSDQCRNRLKIEDAESFPANQASLPFGPMNAIARRVLETLAVDRPTQLDGLIETLAGSASCSEVMATLFDLEMTGLVRQIPGKNYLKAWLD